MLTNSEANKQPKAYHDELLPGGNLVLADNHVGDGLRLVGRLHRLGGIALVALCDVGGEDFAYGKPHERLDKKHLREIGKRQIVAHQTEPTAQKVDNIETIVIGIIECIGQQAHRRAHKTDGGRDDSRLKYHRVVAARVELAAGQTERQRTAHPHRKHKSAYRFDDNHKPYWQITATHVDATLTADGLQDRRGACRPHQGIALDNIKTVEHKRVNGDDNRNQRIHQMLNLILRLHFL